MTVRVPLTRRRFLQIMAGATGALIVGVRQARADDGDTPLALLGDPVTRLGPYVRIEPDGRVILGARDPDCGEGTHTSLPRIIADELDADWTRVEVLSLGPDLVSGNDSLHWRYGHQRSGDGSSIPAAWQDLRTAGALARWLLVQAAAQTSGVAAANLRCENSAVIAPDGRRFDYGSLVKSALRQAPPQTAPPLKTPDRFRLIGRPAGDVDAEAMVRGEEKFAIDQYMAEALTAVVLHCPWPDGTLDSIDTQATLAIPGVRKVLQFQPEPGQPLGSTPIANGVAVLADDTWSALRGRDALKLSWKPGKNANASTAAMEQRAHDLLQSQAEPTRHVREDGDFAEAAKKAAHRVEALYTQPFVAHATAEPMNCLVRIDTDRIHVVTPTQSPQEALTVVQRLTGMPASRIDVQVPRTGGGFGRRLDHDFLAEAVTLAKATGTAVKLMWTRDQDLQHDFYRPGALHRMQALLDRRKRLIGWNVRKASASVLAGREVPADRLWTSENNPDALPAGLIPNFSSTWYELDSPLPRGPSRAGHDVVDAFATQMFLDEIAHVLRKDPLDLRMELLGEPRMLPGMAASIPIDTARLANVLQRVAVRIDWRKRRTNGHGLGIAFHHIDGAYCAHAFEVSVRGERLRIHRAVCAIDVGRVVNPLGLQAQAMGATVDGISTALGQIIQIRDGRIVQTDLHDYPLARMAQLPNEVEVISIPSDLAPTGASIVAMPSAAPALASAVSAATTIRVRRLPLMPELLRKL
ncbi:xanthine dehydrogenase family protein molybdopterin-binding subunit [Oleiagrimonas citrea]|uniref:Xanthine dehydrogenase family protein molybdopterin-binding subunit n=1 Tax=Oleiagrimonas citrea TaxID=1665687 RepID=A0A846ZMU2_9GAMM|nr:molybdopterin cofactor-binding domain-containing protein [Oleiagrimonas citrea]NKZ39615.1 xanthine dehydrogenase family protein molybdopterin-binding subunit [Oleiagrimonas citrea]